MAAGLAAGCTQQSRHVGGQTTGAEDWPLHGGTWDDARFSTLRDVNANNVAQLGLAWSYKIYPDRGMESTPIVADGVMYVTGPFSIVYALDAATGKQLWTYDPQVDRSIANRGCCGPVNRGVALHDGKVYVGALDGRLIALDAKTGHVAWSVDTLIDHTRNYTITGAPIIVRGKVLIGNGGAEYGVRGYVTAYDAQSGKQAWRFFTVPAGPDAPDANTRAMRIAAPTWYGDAYPHQGGGGTVWDSMAYDPELNLLYVGVGNGSFWSRKVRSEGKGDNLFLSSIVALNPDTGEYVWHYQTSPGDEWDFTATQNMILATLDIGGVKRRVLMQAPKNGFFYVLDRKTGKLISANNFVPVNWARGVDPSTGRPLMNDDIARYEDDKLKLVMPAMVGAHNWQPMSYSPATGLVYIPAQIDASYHQTIPNPELSSQLGTMNVGGASLLGVPPAPDDHRPPQASDVPDPTKPGDLARLRKGWRGRLIAWDPVHQRQAWAVDYPQIYNGGTLATAGNLVFQGTADGRFSARRATDGKLLWETPANTGVMAGPVTYRIAGVQYVAVAAGWGGAYPLALGPIAAGAGVQSDARILVYKLGGKAVLPPPKPRPTPAFLPLDGAPSDIAAGKLNFAIHCAVCHGYDAISGGVVPDLRYMSMDTYRNFPQIVQGAYAGAGMPDFSKKLSPQAILQIRSYLAGRNRDLRQDASRASPGALASR